MEHFDPDKPKPAETKGRGPVVTERGLVTIVTTKEDVELAAPLRLMLKVEGIRTQVLGSGLAAGEANIERIDGSVIVIFAPRRDPQPEALLAFSLALAERSALQRVYVTYAAQRSQLGHAAYKAPIIEYASFNPSHEIYQRIAKQVILALGESGTKTEKPDAVSKKPESVPPAHIQLGQTIAGTLSVSSKLAFLWASRTAKVSSEFDSFMFFLGLLATERRLPQSELGLSRSYMMHALVAQIEALDPTWRSLAAFFGQPETLSEFPGVTDVRSIDSLTVVRPQNDVIQIIQRAREFALRSANLSAPWARHLFAAMLASESKTSSVQKSLQSFGFDITMLRRAFLDFILPIDPGREHEWRLLLQDEQFSTERPQKADDILHREVPTNYLARYSPDFVDFRAEPDAGDPLKTRTVARQLAALLAYRETPLPLAVGLFGDWGSGKTTFMQRLRFEIDNLARPEKSGRFCKKVVHIYFNAWHYMDASLWASLVTEIFDGILREVTRGKTDEDKVKAREALVRDLAQARGLVREAHNELEVAKKQRATAETDHAKAVRVRDQHEQTVRGLLDDLATVARGQPGVMANIQEAAEALGWPEGIKSYGELEERVKEIRQLSNRATKLFVMVFGAKNRWRRIVLLVCALTAPLIVGTIVKWLLAHYHVETEQVWAALMQFGVFVAGISGWLSTQIKRGDWYLKRLEKGYAEVTRLRTQKKEGPAEVAARSELAAAEAEEEAKRKRVEEANEKVQALEAELKELEPGRRLFRFIEERASAADYRKHLGLVSLIRRDFEELGHLLSQSNALKDSEQRPIERIVLYVDDLDRCQASRVVEVLEAVHMLLAFPLFVVAVAVDPRWLRSSLEAQYPHLLSLKAGGDEEKRELLRNSTPQDYLEKIFQVPLNLSRIEPEGFGMFVANLAGPPRHEEKVEDRKLEIDHQPKGGAGGLTSLGGEGPDVATDETVQPVAGDVTEPAPVEPDPEQLTLRHWEIESLKRCAPLFRTPRAAKRLVNTYRLLRVGVPPQELAAFEGTAKAPGNYRLPMVLLAVVAGYPSLATMLLSQLRQSTNADWDSFFDTVQNSEVAQAEDWSVMTTRLREVCAAERAPFPQEKITKLLDHVERYSFN